MKRILLLILFFLFNRNLYAQQIQSISLSFKQALEFAKANSPELKRARFALRLADVNTQIIEKQADGNFIYSSMVDTRIAYDKTGALVTLNPHIRIDNKYVENFDQTHSLSWNQNVYDFGRLTAQINSSILQKQVVEQQVQEVDEQLLYKVARAYLAVLVAVEIERTTQLRLTNSQKKQSEVSRGYLRGEKSEVDEVKARADVARAKLAFQRSQDEVNLAQKQLVAFFETSDESTQKYIFPDLKLKSSKEWGDLVQKWGSIPGKNATSLRREADRAYLQSQIPVLEKSKLPIITAQVSAQYAGSFSPLYPSINGQLQFTYNIPWNGIENDQKQQILLQKQDSEIQDEVDLKIRVDTLKNAQNKIRYSLAEIENIENQVKLLEKYRELIRARYNVGKATALEVSLTEDDVINAYLDASKVQSIIANAALDVAQAMGVKDVEILF